MSKLRSALKRAEINANRWAATHGAPHVTRQGWAIVASFVSGLFRAAPPLCLGDVALLATNTTIARLVAHSRGEARPRRNRCHFAGLICLKRVHRLPRIFWADICAKDS